MKNKLSSYKQNTISLLFLEELFLKKNKNKHERELVFYLFKITYVDFFFTSTPNTKNSINY